MSEASRKLNILLVEDDRVDVMNVERAFQQARIANPLWVVGDGIEALEKLRAGEVPRDDLLILLDLNLPRMDGIEFLQRLRADDELARTPVVILTTSDAESDRTRAYDFNVAGYIVKPVTFGSFVDAVVTLNKYWMLVEMP
jgi:CheY-like chemotaxis protein